MNLKEAFRYQNKIKNLMDEATNILNERENVTRTETTFLRKRVMPEAEDECFLRESPSEYSEHINEVVSFLMDLLAEREKLARAIHTAKDKLPIDMDSEVSLNHQRQELAATFRNMVGIRPSERIISGGGDGYRFNAEGNQVLYRCDAKVITTINFDRKRVRKLAQQLDQSSDSVSTEIDRCMVNYEVAYTPIFDLNASFDELLQDYIEKQNDKFRYQI